MKKLHILGLSRWLASFSLAFGAVAAHADDNDACEALLCFSNPAGWNAVAQCVPPVERFLKSIVTGSFPTCAFVGPGTTSPGTFMGNGWQPERNMANQASVAISARPDCPSTQATGTLTCHYSNRISVDIDGKNYMRVYFNFNGMPVTELVGADGKTDSERINDAWVNANPQGAVSGFGG